MILIGKLNAFFSRNEIVRKNVMVTEFFDVLWWKDVIFRLFNNF